MTRKSVALAAMLVVATLAAISAAVALSLPADAQLPTHWSLSGEADGFAGKCRALLIPPLMVAALSLLFFFLPALEPRKQGLERSQSFYLWSWIAVLLMGAVMELTVVSVALRWPIHATSLIMGGIGAMLVLIGNQLGKTRSMYLIGFRTPWTLASEEVWIKTHRLAGKLMVGGGIVTMVSALLRFPSGLAATIMVATVAVVAGVPIVYSYLLWRRERQVSE